MTFAEMIDRLVALPVGSHWHVAATDIVVHRLAQHLFVVVVCADHAKVFATPGICAIYVWGLTSNVT